MPSATIKGIEFVSPVKDEFTGVLIIVEYFNIVIKYIPWHIMWVEAISP